MLAWSLSGVCTEMAGWQWSFYGNGSICLAFSLLWFYVVRDSPAQHPRITTTERDWIVGNQTAVQPDARRWPPLTQMLCSGPFWMLVVSHYGHLWGWNFLMTSAPRFIYEVLGFDLSWTGALASATYLTRPVAGVVSAAASDGLINGLGLSVAAVRKGMTVVCEYMVFDWFLGVGIRFTGVHPRCVRCSPCAERRLFAADWPGRCGPECGSLVCYADYCVDAVQWGRVCDEQSGSARFGAEFRGLCVRVCQYGDVDDGLSDADAGRLCDRAGGK